MVARRKPEKSTIQQKFSHGKRIIRETGMKILIPHLLWITL